MKGKQKILKQLLAMVLSLVMVSGMVTQSVQLRAISLDEIPIAEEQQAEPQKIQEGTGQNGNNNTPQVPESTKTCTVTQCPDRRQHQYGVFGNTWRKQF